MRLTLLGTGNPRPNPRRAGPSQHVAVGDASLLVGLLSDGTNWHADAPPLAPPTNGPGDR